MAIDQFEVLIEQISGDERATALFVRLLDATQAQRQAAAEFRAYMNRGTLSAQPTSVSEGPRQRGAPARSDSLAQKAFQFVTDFNNGQPVATEEIAEHLQVTEAQVRGALKRFVREKTIIKPRRGLWQRGDGGRLSVNGAHAAR